MSAARGRTRARWATGVLVVTSIAGTTAATAAAWPGARAASQRAAPVPGTTTAPPGATTPGATTQAPLAPTAPSFSPPPVVSGGSGSASVTSGGS